MEALHKTPGSAAEGDKRIRDRLHKGSMLGGSYSMYRRQRLGLGLVAILGAMLIGVTPALAWTGYSESRTLYTQYWWPAYSNSWSGTAYYDTNWKMYQSVSGTGQVYYVLGPVETDSLVPNANNPQGGDNGALYNFGASVQVYLNNGSLVSSFTLPSNSNCGAPYPYKTSNDLFAWRCTTSNTYLYTSNYPPGYMVVTATWSGNDATSYTYTSSHITLYNG